jgi:hypothetical protein
LVCPLLNIATAYISIASNSRRFFSSTSGYASKARRGGDWLIPRSHFDTWCVRDTRHRICLCGVNLGLPTEYIVWGNPAIDTPLDICQLLARGKYMGYEHTMRDTIDGTVEWSPNTWHIVCFLLYRSEGSALLHMSRWPVLLHVCASPLF